MVRPENAVEAKAIDYAQLDGLLEEYYQSGYESEETADKLQVFFEASDGQVRAGGNSYDYAVRGLDRSIRYNYPSHPRPHYVKVGYEVYAVVAVLSDGIVIETSSMLMNQPFIRWRDMRTFPDDDPV